MKECNCGCQTIIHEDIVESSKNIMLEEGKLIDMADFFKIFGDYTRLKIINILLHNKMCVSDIASTLGVSHSLVSHQLRVLKEFKVVKFNKFGKIVYYELDDSHIKKIFDEGCEHINE
jgi:Predicted transcriptional regulators